MVRYSTRRWIQILGYIVATIFVLGGTALLIAYGNGYSYDLKTGRLLHRGLIIIDSTPSGADITLKNKPISPKTPYRQVFVAGSYRFSLSKSGYQTWSKTLAVVPSQVTLADYVILLPNHIPVRQLASYPAVSQSIVSRDHHHIAFVVPSGDNPGVWALDTSSNQLTRLYSLAAATATAPAETATLLSWSDDNSRVLVRSQTGATTSLLAVAANGSDQPVNITSTLGVAATDLTFDPSNWHQLYWQSPEGLRRLDLSSQNESAPLAEHVAAFTFAGDRIVYVDASKSPASLWVMNSDGSSKQKLIARLPASQTYEAAYGSYLGTDELAVTAQDSGLTTLYSNVFGTPTTKTLPAIGQHLQFSDDAHFLLQYDSSHVATYDLERSVTYTLPPADSSVTGINWFDNAHLEFDRGGQTELSEYDGNYTVGLTRTAGLAPFSSSDGKRVFVTVATASGTIALKVVQVRQ